MYDREIKTLQSLALFLFLILVGFKSDALEVIKIKGDRALIQLDGEKVSVGERLDVLNMSGEKIGVVRVTSLNETKALTKVESGRPSVGLKAAKRITTLKSFDFRVNPLIVLGAVNGNLDVRLNENLTVGLQGAYLQAKLNSTGIFNSDLNITAYGIGARANWFFSGAFQDGFYLGPSLEYLSVSIKTSTAAGPASGTASGQLASCLIGYGWFWPGGLNIMLGGGYAGVLGASGITIKDSVGNQQTITANLSGLTYELSLGYAF